MPTSDTPPTAAPRPLRVSRLPSRVAAYLLAVLAVGAATGLTMVVVPEIEHVSGLFYVLAVAVAAWYGGRGPGIVSALLSVASFDYFFLVPYHAISLLSGDDLLQLAILAVVSATVVWISNSLTAARTAAERHAAETTRLLGELHERSEELSRLLEESQLASQELELGNEQLLAAMVAAEDAEKQVRTILESISDAFIALDADLHFRYINRRAIEVFAGRGSDERSAVEGRALLEVYPELRGTTFESGIRRALAERRPVTLEVHHPPREEWDEVRCYPTPDGGLAVYWTDVTERRRGEELRALLAAVVESSDDAIISKTLDGTILSWNAAAERLFGWRASEAVGQPITLIIPPDHLEEEPEILARLARGEHVDHFETVRMRRDGTRVDVSVSISPVRDAGGRIVSASKVVRDITRQRRAVEGQRLLADASALLSASLDPDATLTAVADLVVPRFADCCITYAAGEAGLRHLRAAHADAAAAERLRARLPGDSTGTAPGAIAEVLRTGRALLIPLLTPTSIDAGSHGAGARDGAYRRIIDELRLHSGMIVPLAARGHVLGVMAMFNAESGRRFDADDLALAEELGRRGGLAMDNARLYDAERRARAEAESARAEAVGANQAKTQFLATMSHELRTPLNAIAGYTELLSLGVRGPVTTAQIEDLARIQRSQRHLLSLINDVLNFARIESGHLDLDLRPVSVEEAVGALEALVRPQLDEKHLAYRHEPLDADILVLADREKLQQVVLNLLSNAIKFTASGGLITIAGTADGERVSIRVSDTGRGIPASKLGVIFDPFVQVERSLNRPLEGTGLGLAISRDLARAMHGDLTVESRVGEGTTFTLTLPRAIV